MKIELKIEAPGVQVFAYEINEETKALLEENAKNVFVECGIPEIDEAEEKRIKENEEKGFVYRSPMEIVEEKAKLHSFLTALQLDTKAANILPPLTETRNRFIQLCLNMMKWKILKTQITSRML